MLGTPALKGLIKHFLFSRRMQSSTDCHADTNRLLPEIQPPRKTRNYPDCGYKIIFIFLARPWMKKYVGVMFKQSCLLRLIRSLVAWVDAGEG